MNYIGDKTLYKAVMFAKKMINDGQSPGLANHRAAKYYDVNVGDVAKYAGQSRAARAKPKKTAPTIVPLDLKCSVCCTPIKTSVQLGSIEFIWAVDDGIVDDAVMACGGTCAEKERRRQWTFFGLNCDRFVTLGSLSSTRCVNNMLATSRWPTAMVTRVRRISAAVKQITG